MLLGKEGQEMVKEDVNEYLKALKGSAKFAPQIVCHNQLAAIDPVFTKRAELREDLARLLDSLGVKNLFTHQHRAIAEILSGNDVIVATPTASGKSMIYHLPTLLEIQRDASSHFLYLFPLKALAQDQKSSLCALYDKAFSGIRDRGNPVAIFDGDTKASMRRKIRENPPPVLISNPEMLHLSMLPYHDAWRSFFTSLRYIVIDEVHTYRGVFGSHIAWLLKRLQRVAAYYGANPVFILLSATIGNPAELGEALLGRQPYSITRSGASQAERNMVFLNPMDSAAQAGCLLLEAAVKRGLRTIVYTGSRRMTELISMWTKPRLGPLANKLSSYRAGFLPEERREIESQLQDGSLLGVISTSALELGIDIGDLDICILVGYPGSIMATWQRGGRVGRANRTSAIVLIAGEDALDQYFMRNPAEFFNKKPEAAVINPENPKVISQQLLCAAAEIPVSREEISFFKGPVLTMLSHLQSKGQLLKTAAEGLLIASRKYPHRDVFLRGGGSQIAIVDGLSGEIIGEIDARRACQECHPGAIYLHRGINYLVTRLDLQAHEAVVTLSEPSYFTRPTIDKHTEIMEVIATKTCLGIPISYGKVKVREQVCGFQKRNTKTHKLIATEPLDLPENCIETNGLWLEIPPDFQNEVEAQKLHFMGAIHALEHGLIALFPLIVLCDRNDIGGISCPVHDQTRNPVIFIYDAQPGGAGLAQQAYHDCRQLLDKTLEAVVSCSCENGCPSCVHSLKCGSGNRPIDKRGCSLLLSLLADPKKPASDNRPIRPTSLNQQETPVTARPLPLLFSKIPDRAENDFSTDPKKILPKRYGVWDLETKYSAKEVGGWHRAEKMGICMLVVYDSLLDDYKAYEEKDIDQAVAHLLSLDLVVGFNNKRFDNRVLSAYTNHDLSRLPSLDLLEEVHTFLGYRLSLANLASTSLGHAKSADGLQSLIWYRQGKMDLIRDYCKKDVEITGELFLFALQNGYLLFTNKAKQAVHLPLNLAERIKQISLKIV